MPDTFAGAHGPHIHVSVVVIVVTLSAVLILSGLLHLLARCLGWRRAARGGAAPRVREHSLLVSALHGQLHQLFHMHDAGVEQAFIDALPVFAYDSIRGLKDSTDCAVCLTEFGDDDHLRLLPKCKHAFHIECIDTWLLSNSTCPLCRRSLLPDGPHLTGASTSAPIREDQLLAQHSRRTTIASSSSDDSENEIQEIKELDEQIRHEGTGVETPSPFAPTIRIMDVHGTQRVLKVELGRVAQSDSDSRKLTLSRGARSYSMGSYEYIVDPASWELRMAPTPYPGRHTPQLQPECSRSTHRSALSDSIPELGVDELFWASRGLYNPNTLSRVRELLPPFGSEGFSPYLDSSSSPGWIDIDIERGAIVEEQPGPHLLISSQGASDIKQRSSSLSRLPTEPKLTVSSFRRSFSAGMEQDVISDEALKLQAASSSICDETLKQGSFSRRFSLNWLMARDKRMVFAAASPERPRPITM